eukprot:2494486-Pyramimonas_sp.AAC.1
MGVAGGIGVGGSRRIADALATHRGCIGDALPTCRPRRRRTGRCRREASRALHRAASAMHRRCSGDAARTPDAIYVHQPHQGGPDQ